VALAREAGYSMTSVEPVDLSSSEDADRLITSAVEAFGDFDILYNNAAAMRTGRIDEMALVDFEWTMRNEISVIFNAIKASVPVFERRGGGAVVNIASTAGIYGAGFPGNARGMLAHCVGKAAVIRMTEVLAIELSALKVRVNAISPGVTDTPAIRPFLANDGVRTLFTNFSLLHSIGRPEDVVNAAVFLASDEASLITGCNLPVDGGQSVGAGQGQPDLGVESLLAGAMGAADQSVAGRS
jgi:NAD(P)-dependent dehydrogenase (short-subunit alcohol dehydrogenase family)